jgi:multicomponent Na+:H+ antiporter subunit G
MSALTQLVVAALVAGGVAFCAVAALGLVRLPDLYSRTHAASKSETLGAALALAAAAVAVGPDPALAKLGLLLLFVFVTGPTAAHAIARAAYEEGHRPWERPDDGPLAGAGDAAVTDGGDSLALDARDGAEVDR